MTVYAAREDYCWIAPMTTRLRCATKKLRPSKTMKRCGSPDGKPKSRLNVGCYKDPAI